MYIPYTSYTSYAFRIYTIYTIYVIYILYTQFYTFFGTYYNVWMKPSFMLRCPQLGGGFEVNTIGETYLLTKLPLDGV